VRSDWISAVPLALIATLLLAAPRQAVAFARGGFGAHLLDLNSIRRIEREDFPNSSLRANGSAQRAAR
jgi:hypothetical protein